MISLMLAPWNTVSRRWILLILTTVLPGGWLTHAEPTGLRPWTNYQVIMWVGDSAQRQPDKFPLFVQRLREMGVTAGMVHNDGRAEPWLQAGFPYYVENLVNRGLCLKWNSKVTDWDKMVTEWRVQRQESGLVRDYCLEEPQWRGWASNEVRRLATRHAPHKPLAYNLRDELSTTISANPFDYDFHPASLAAFRSWLQGEHGTLERLNAAWETRFATWDEVKPFTTDQIKNRMASGDAKPQGKPDWQALQNLRFEPLAARRTPTRWNFAPWCDFRSFMDHSLATTLDHLRTVARQMDPATPVGIEGTQMPHAFGGYDLARLARALDWVEPYDIGNSREIFGSFMPGKPILCTVGEKDARSAQRRLWHLLLLGDKGCIIWWSEDCMDWKSADYPLTPRARGLAPVFQELTSPLAHLFLNARRETDPIHLLYSQPSIQAGWLLESTVDGSTWLRRFSSFESAHNRMAKARNAWLKAFLDLGYAPQFVDRTELAQTLAKPGPQVLVMPSAVALSDTEISAVLKWRQADAAAGEKLLLADGSPGLFDDRGKLRVNSPMDPLLPPQPPAAVSYALRGNQREAVAKNGDIAGYGRARLLPQPDLAWLEWIRAQLPPLPLTVQCPATARVQAHRYRLGQARLVALERAVDYQMSEDLKQGGGNESLETEIPVTVRFTQPGHVYDLRTGRYLGATGDIPLVINPWSPTLLAILPEPVTVKDLVRHLGEQR
jgi:hypothetical protein